VDIKPRNQPNLKHPNPELSRDMGSHGQMSDKSSLETAIPAVQLREPEEPEEANARPTEIQERKNPNLDNSWKPQSHSSSLDEMNNDVTMGT